MLLSNLYRFYFIRPANLKIKFMSLLVLLVASLWVTPSFCADAGGAKELDPVQIIKGAIKRHAIAVTATDWIAQLAAMREILAVLEGSEPSKALEPSAANEDVINRLAGKFLEKAERRATRAGNLAAVKTKLAELISAPAASSVPVTPKPSAAVPVASRVPVSGAGDRDRFGGGSGGGSGGGGAAMPVPVLAPGLKAVDCSAPFKNFPFNPFIGFYGDPYLLRDRLLIVEGAVDSFRRIAPRDVQAAVGDIGGREFKFFINIYGKLDRRAPSPATSTHNNVLFHQIVARWSGRPDPFEIPTDMGLFAPNGVTTRGIAGGGELPEGRLGKVSVHLHQGYYSPNNARFKLIEGRKMVSFWLIGKDAGHTLATFNLIIDSDDIAPVRAAIENIRTSENLERLSINFSETLAKTSVSVPAGSKLAEDIRTLADFNVALINLVSA